MLIIQPMEQFGKYEVLEKIGEGGFGIIYKGFDPLIKRHVAIKTCNSEEPEVRKRFFREAEIAGNLQHRNITIVYDFGLEGEVPYLVQEYLSGTDLNRKIKSREYLPFATKLLYLIQVARGLEHAHSSGVIHRDIKPGNIRILEDDAVKIMDFGIAKLAQGGTGLTQTGKTIGTAAYLAPEQIRGEEIDHRADIFSYGLLAYELLTYQRPFRGTNPSAVLYQILTETPTPMQQLWPECPPEMIRIVERCLKKTVAERYQDCGQLLADLDELLQARRNERSSAKPASGPGLKPHLPTRSAPAAPAALSSAPPSTAGASDSTPSAGSPDPRFSTRASIGQETVRILPQPGLDQVDLKARSRSARPPVPIPKPPPAPVRKGRGLTWIVLLILLAGVGAAGAWFWRSGGWPFDLGAILGDSSPTDPTTPRAGPGTGTGAANAAPAARSAADSPGDGTDQANAATPKATLVLPRAWDPEMTLSINGGRALRLYRERSLQVAPGSYELAFDLVGRDYNATARSTISLRDGQTRNVEIAIPRPGELTVRQTIGSPQAWVLCNGQALGWSPIERRKLPPGRHALVLTHGPEASTEGSLQEEVTLRSNRELVVTFDLERRQRPQIMERLLDGS